MVVYAPNGTNEHRDLWHEIAKNLDGHNRRWIMVGDINMVENIADRKGGLGKVLNGPDKRAWNRVKHKLWLEDSFCYKVGHLKYS